VTKEEINLVVKKSRETDSGGVKKRRESRKDGRAGRREGSTKLTGSLRKALKVRWVQEM